MWLIEGFGVFFVSCDRFDFVSSLGMTKLASAVSLVFVLIGLVVFCRAVGATIVNCTEELKDEDVGTGCGLFEIQKIGDE